LCVPAARLANLRAAAEELHLTHSAVSQQIKPALAQLDDGMLEVHTSQQIVDLKREAFHAALRQGSGQWPGLDAERLIDSPLIAVGSPGAARRLLGREPVALRDGRLMRLSTLALSKDQAYALWFAYPSGLRDWAPLVVRRAAAVRTGAACTGATAHPAACKRSASASISGASASGLSSPASAP
jgi:DNA-binding transcriptional LysR family regulator